MYLSADNGKTWVKAATVSYDHERQTIPGLAAFNPVVVTVIAAVICEEFQDRSLLDQCKAMSLIYHNDDATFFVRMAPPPANDAEAVEDRVINGLTFGATKYRRTDARFETSFGPNGSGRVTVQLRGIEEPS